MGSYIEPIYLGGRFVAGLSAGNTSSESSIVTIPNIPLGTYYLSAIADHYSFIPESDENNNARVSSDPIVLTSTPVTTTTTTTTSTTTTTILPNQPPSADSLTPVNISIEP